MRTTTTTATNPTTTTDHTTATMDPTTTMYPTTMTTDPTTTDQRTMNSTTTDPPTIMCFLTKRSWNFDSCLFHYKIKIYPCQIKIYLRHHLLLNFKMYLRAK